MTRQWLSEEDRSDQHACAQSGSSFLNYLSEYQTSGNIRCRYLVCRGTRRSTCFPYKRDSVLNCNSSPSMICLTSLIPVALSTKKSAPACIHFLRLGSDDWLVSMMTTGARRSLLIFVST